MQPKTFTLYKIYSADILLYIGRTKQPLQSRIRGHLFSKPMHRMIDIDHVSRIEYAEFATEADMNLYEIYYILTLKPPLNVDDKTKDYPTVTLPDVSWHEFRTPLWGKWANQLHAERARGEEIRLRLLAIEQERHIIRGKYRVGEITQDERDQAMESLNAEKKKLAAEKDNLRW